jgi:hypothetical protein
MCWALNHQNTMEMAQGHISLSSVRCTRNVQMSTSHSREFQGALRYNTPSHSREFQGALRYNSPDCPVSQRSNDYLHQRSTLTAGTVQHSTMQK